MKKLLDILGKVIEWIGIVTAGLMFLLLAYQILIRIFFRGSSPASSELVSYLFIWFVYIGMVVAAKNKSHISVTMLADAFPPKVRASINLAAHLCWLYFSGYVVYIGIVLVKKVSLLGSASPILHIPLHILYMILPVTFAWSAIYIVRDIVEEIRVIAGKKE